MCLNEVLTFKMEKMLMLMQFTEREQEINDYLIVGMSTTEVSKKLGLPIVAIENHRRNIKKNLMDKIPLQFLSGRHEDSEGFFDFGWIYHFAF